MTRAKRLSVKGPRMGMKLGSFGGTMGGKMGLAKSNIGRIGRKSRRRS